MPSDYEKIIFRDFGLFIIFAIIFIIILIFKPVSESGEKTINLYKEKIKYDITDIFKNYILNNEFIPIIVYDYIFANPELIDPNLELPNELKGIKNKDGIEMVNMLYCEDLIFNEDKSKIIITDKLKNKLV
jgi:hypothetical protein